MAGGDRTISVLKLFTLDAPAWTVEEVAARLAVSASTAYRYVAVLTEAGLLTNAASGRYVLGPAFIQYDRQIQLTDPLLHVARPAMDALLRAAPQGSTILLCRLFRDIVLCVHQAAGAGGSGAVSYERGRPMPLFRGATSKILLPYLPPRDLRRLYETHRDAAEAAGLGAVWPEFRVAVSRLRRDGHCISAGEVDPDRIGIAVAILDDRKRVLGSLSIVIPEAAEQEAGSLVAKLAAQARAVEQALRPAAAQGEGVVEAEFAYTENFALR
jgi:DNA-binding IclR family transcriptional regulator